MPVQAKHTINTGDYVYNPGEIISDLTAEEEQRLIELGAVVAVNGDNSKGGEDDSFALALAVMTNEDISNYGKSIGLEFASKATRASMIADILACDADINLGLLSDAALRTMVEAEHLEVPEDATREQLIDFLGE